MELKENLVKSMKKELFRSIFFALIIIVILLSINFVSAYKLLCLGYGDKIPTEENPRYTCFHDQCQVCVTDNNYPTRPSRCNDVGACQSLDGGGNNNEAPELIVDSPENGAVYDSRRILFDLSSNQPVSISYLDNINGRGRWRRLASNIKSYFRLLGFREGLNDVIIKATNRYGNSVEVEREFIIDSRSPRIRSTDPRRGFANGYFYVEFNEENPINLVLNYGNSRTGYKDIEVDIDSCELYRKRYSCETKVGLNEYDGHSIEYWFVIEDIAGSTDESRHNWLDVDITDPVILNDDWYSQGEGRNNRYIYFDIEIDEDNFDEVSYYDNEANRPSWRRICSRLRNDRCVRKVSFRRGIHSLDVQVTDEAGNAIAKRLDFEVF